MDERLGEVLDWFDESESDGAVGFVVSPEGDLFALGGWHGASGWCWCQPDLVWRTCPAGHTHSIVMHRRSSDESGAVSDARCDAGWRVTPDGDVYPRRNWPAGLDMDALDA